jgi:hypothetical protein
MKNMMTYYEALTKDSLGSRKFKAQIDNDNIKFDEDAVRKKEKKIDSETSSIANAVEASKEVRLRANEKKKGHDLEYNDDSVTVQQEIDDTVYTVQVSQIPSNKSTKIWISRPEHWHAIVQIVMTLHAKCTRQICHI